MASITVTITRSVAPDGKYSVVATAGSANNMPKEVFVYVAGTGLYDHIASLHEVLTLPTVATSGVAFYRRNTASITTASLAVAIEASTTIKTRLTALAQEYDAAITSFIGSETVVLPG